MRSVKSPKTGVITPWIAPAAQTIVFEWAIAEHAKRSPAAGSG